MIRQLGLIKHLLKNLRLLKENWVKNLVTEVAVLANHRLVA